MRRSVELEAVIRRFFDARVGPDAWTDADVDAMKAVASRSEFLRQIGNERDAWAQGFDAVVQTWIDTQFQDSRRITDAAILRIEAYDNGETGWAAIEQERTLANGHVVVFRITTVFVLEGFSWKLVQIHISTPVADEQVLGVNLSSTLTDLLSSISVDDDGGRTLDGTLSTASVLFTDVVGSTSLSQAMGDVAWSELIAAHFVAAEAIAVENGGVVIKTVGDGGMYVFSAGTSALRAATAMQRATTEPGGHALELRVGVHTGDVVRSKSDFLGLTVNKAARVAAAAEGGEILVSASTVDMINDAGFEFGIPVVAALKGIDGTHELRPLHWR